MMRMCVFLCVSAGVVSGQPVDWLGPADGSWQDPANWVGGASPNLITQEPTLALAGAYTVTSSASTSHGLLRIINADATLRLSSATHFLYDNVTNAGMILLESSSLEFRGVDQQIDGPGTITLAALTNPVFSAIVADALQATNGQGHTINGNGSVAISGGGASWRNAGIIVADDPGGVGIELNSVGLTQGGTGRIGADGGTLILRNGASITGGELFVINGGSVEVQGIAPVRLDSVTVTGRIEIDETGDTIALDGPINLQGEIALNPSGSANDAMLRIDVDAEIFGSGEIILNREGFSEGVLAMGSATQGIIGPDITVRGSGCLRATGGEIVNNGLIVADDPDDSLVLQGRFSGDGIFGANDARLFLGDFVNLVDCTLNTQAGGVVVVGENIVTLSGGRNDGAIELLPESGLRINGTYINNGAISQPFTDFGTELITLSDGATLAGDGVVRLESRSRSGLTSSGSPGTVGIRQTLAGEFILDGDLLIEGVIDPESCVVIEGEVELLPSATVLLLLDEPSTPSNDRIDVVFGQGELTLGGTMVVELRPGFTPDVGDQWTLVSGEQGLELFGAFDIVDLPEPPSGLAFEIEHVQLGIRLSVLEGCGADLAEPFGTLNFFDLAAFIGFFNMGDAAADFAAPFGSLNFFDVAEYIAQFNAGCP